MEATIIDGKLLAFIVRWLRAYHPTVWYMIPLDHDLIKIARKSSDIVHDSFRFYRAVKYSATLTVKDRHFLLCTTSTLPTLIYS